MANIALPGTSSFVGEFLILAGAFQTNTTVCVLSATGMILVEVTLYGYSTVLLW